MSETDADRVGVLQPLLAALLLLVCFIFGGDSAHAGFGMTVAELLALPTLMLAAVCAHRRGRIRAARWGVLAASLIVALPLLQLLPLPAWIWSLPAERAALQQDLHAVGITSPDSNWSLAPSASERDFYFLLPGAALFMSMLAVGRTQWRRMLGWVVGLGLANLLFAVVLVAAGKGHFLNPYPELAPALGGIFANKNHQADLLAVGLMIVLVFLIEAWGRARSGRQSLAVVALFMLLALMFLVALPLVGSRAGVIVGMLMLIGVLLSTGLPTLRSVRASRHVQVGSLFALVIFVLGLQAALGWIRSDSALEGSRSAMTAETLRIGVEHAPLGAGIGAFVPAFEQGADESLLTYHYINNAHDDYAQWWLEGGVLAVLVVLLVLAVLLRTLFALLGQRPESRGRTCGMAALMGIGVIVLHSTVDYPLRTGAMMAVFAVLSGIAVGAAGSEATAPTSSRRRRDRGLPSQV